ncbi:hypothetical protein C0J52_03083 [Blattella germanica]|nr:hypothetical protein C0J52_03083 [Blattella germanica]
MADNKPQFDALLGGCHSLPVEMSVRRFISARAQEIEALTQAIDDPQRTGLVFQKLPKHMRRRAMSRTAKRLPRRLREAHMHQDLSYYCCIELNGYENQLLDSLQMLTSKDCGLTFGAKAFLKGTREGSVMMFHQNSYPLGAIGRVSFLWKPIVEEKTNSERTIWLWVHPAFYQEVLEELISVFNFIQKESTLSSLVYPDTQSEFSSNSDGEDAEKDITSPMKKRVKFDGVKKKENVEKIKLGTRNLPFERTPKYQTRDGGIEMVLLKDTLNRFRLTGPLSQAALLESIQVANMMEENITEISETNWWKEFYTLSEDHKASWSYQNKLWESLRSTTSPAQLPPHSVLALTVRDPRLQLPSKRTKAVPDDQVSALSEQIPEFSPLACISPLWSSEVRDQATQSKLSTGELAELRSQNLVPGFMLEELGFDMDDEDSNVITNKTARMKSFIPILLIQRPGSKNAAHKRLGFSSGWDIVMPAGWALPFWLGLTFRGARPGGLRETSSIEFEASSEHVFSPDTEADYKESESQQLQLKEHHFRLPPDKRPNYAKLGITSPFACTWKILVNEWSNISSDGESVVDHKEKNSRFFIMRDKKKLESMNIAVNNLKSKKSKSVASIELDKTISNSCLVHIAFHMHTKGNPSDFAIICLPQDEDINKISKDSSYPGPVEQLHIDEFQEERKQARVEHKKLLKRLRRKRVREKLKQEDLAAEKAASQEENTLCSVPVTTKRKTTESPPTKDIVEKHAVNMQSLWLPETKSVRNSCSREVIGFIKKGDFSFTESQGVGQGYIVFPALLKLLASCQERKLKNISCLPWVLVRNPTSLQYRFGIIDIQL